MKLIIAMIRPEKLAAVQDALDEPGAYLVAVSEAVDLREPCSRGTYRGLPVRLPRPRLRLEVVVVNEAVLEWTVNAIARAGSTSDRERLGDGDILVMPLGEHVRISAKPLEEQPSDDAEYAGTLPPLHLGRYRA